MLEITCEKTATKTGYFEVQVVDGPVLHSKMNGDGHVTPAKFEVIVAGVEKELGVTGGSDVEDKTTPKKSSPKKAAKVVTKKKPTLKKSTATATTAKGKRKNAAPVVGEGSPVAKRTRRK